MIGCEVHIEPGAHLEECVIMDRVRIEAHARLQRAIADRFSRIPPDSSTGLVVVPLNTDVPAPLMPYKS